MLSRTPSLPRLVRMKAPRLPAHLPSTLLGSLADPEHGSHFCVMFRLRLVCFSQKCLRGSFRLELLTHPRGGLLCTLLIEDARSSALARGIWRYICSSAFHGSG